MNYSAVIFDLFGTLVDDFPSSVGEMHKELALALAVPYEQFIPLWSQTTEMRITGAFDTVEANIKYVCDIMNVRPRAERMTKAVKIRTNSVRQAVRPTPPTSSAMT